MDSVFWLEQIQPQDCPQVGEPVVTLGQLQQLGNPVLPGFVIPTTLLQTFLTRIETSASPLVNFSTLPLKVNLDRLPEVRAIANQLQTAIQSTPFPEEWFLSMEQAVRHLDARILRLQPVLWELDQPNQPPWMQELLQVQFCWGHPQELIQAIQQLWATVFQAKHLLVWQRAGISPQRLGLSILVQPARPAQVSGWLRATATSWQIQATWGLSPALALGEVLPDTYTLDRQSGQVQHHSLGQKTYAYRLAEALNQDCLCGYSLNGQQHTPVLTDEQLQQLSSLARTIENDCQENLDSESNFGFEWMLVEERFYLLRIEGKPGVVLQPNSSDSPPPEGGIALGEHASPILLASGLVAASGQAIAPALVITHPSPDLAESFPTPVILVVRSLQPDWLPLMHQAAGIICELGGMTSHGAIMARELGLPAVVGVPQATTLIQSGEMLLLDGNQGQIYRLTADCPLPLVPAGRSTLMSEPPPSVLSVSTQLMVNLSQSIALEATRSLPVDGVGLLRSELMLLDLLQRHHPYAWLQQGRQQDLIQQWAERIGRFAAAFAPRPVFYRSLDLRSHECQTLIGGQAFEPLETNPMLGQRGVSRYISHPELFSLELAALSQAYRQGYTQVRLLLPFVRTVEEFNFCRQQATAAGLLDYPQFQLWIMAEVPSVLFLLPEYVRSGVQGISIGTNDLTQLLLGVDREQSHLGYPYDERHPAVKVAIAQLIRTAQDLGIPCSICGEAPVRYPEFIPWLINLGITCISVAPEAVMPTRRAIAQAEQQLYTLGRLAR